MLLEDCLHNKNCYLCTGFLEDDAVWPTCDGSSPEGLKYNYLDQISDEDLQFLQKIAWKAHLMHKKQYNISND